MKVDYRIPFFSLLTVIHINQRNLCFLCPTAIVLQNLSLVFHQTFFNDSRVILQANLCVFWVGVKVAQDSFQAGRCLQMCRVER